MERDGRVDGKNDAVLLKLSTGPKAREAFTDFGKGVTYSL